MQVKFELSKETKVYYTPDGNFLLSKKDGTAVVLSPEKMKGLAEATLSPEEIEGLAEIGLSPEELIGLAKVYPQAEKSKHDMEL